MQIRLKPKQLWRRLELAKINARSHHARSEIFAAARHREWERNFEAQKREDDYKRLTLSNSEYCAYLCSRLSMDFTWPMIQIDSSWKALNQLEKLGQICAQADDWVELDHEEWSLIENWRKAKFAAHPSNAEAFPEIAESSRLTA